MQAWLSAYWSGPNAGPDMAVILSLVIVGGAVAGEIIARYSRLPRLVGYTLAGCVAAIGGFGVDVPLAPTVRQLVDVALGLLLFEIGSRVRLRWLHHNPGLLTMSLLESAAAAAAVYFALGQVGFSPLAAATCAVLAIPASASVAGRVAHEIRAAGQVTQRMEALTALNTLYGVLALVVLLAGVEAERTPDWPTALAAVVASTAGALVLAVLLGLAVAQAARRLDLRQEGATLLVLGLILLAVACARWLGLSTLLVPLLAGLALRNASDRAWAWPRHFGTAGALLVLLLFVVVGSAWSPQVLATGGVAALVLLGARWAAKSAVIFALSRWSSLSFRKGAALSLTLTPLSATALVMLSEVHQIDPALGAVVAPALLSAIAMLELLGALLVLWALRAAGEVAP